MPPARRARPRRKPAHSAIDSDRPARNRHRPRTRPLLAIGFAALLVFSIFGTLAPASARCSLPGRIGCPGGILGPTSPRLGGGDQWFNVILYDYGFWITNTVSDANESSNWTLFEGYMIHVNTTSAAPDSSVGGTGAHGLGLRWSGTGSDFAQIAPQGSWVSGSFQAPTTAVQGGTVYCTNYCGSGHEGMVVNILTIEPATSNPTVAISATPTAGYAPLAVRFAATVGSGTSPYAFRWAFGDGSSSVLANPTHTYNLAGSFNATLLAIDRNGLSRSSFPVAITAEATPAFGAEANGTPRSGSAPLAVSFSSSAHGGLPPYTYSWAFGDGGIGVGANASHIYTVGGSYVAVVAASDARGVATGATVPVSVASATEGPLAVDAIVVPVAGDLPFSLTATASVSGGNGTPGPITWDFGDGSARAQGAQVTHTYSHVDAGTVRLLALVGTSRGQLAWTTVPVSLFPSPSGSVAIRLPHAWAPATVSLSVELAGGNGTYAPISWDFGDGSISRGADAVNHSYAAPGDYRVSVSTRDSTGQSILSTAWVNLTVNQSLGQSATPTLQVSAGGAPLAFLGAVGGTGLLLVLVGAVRDRRRESEPPWEEP